MKEITFIFAQKIPKRFYNQLILNAFLKQSVQEIKIESDFFVPYLRYINDNDPNVRTLSTFHQTILIPNYLYKYIATRLYKIV